MKELLFISINDHIPWGGSEVLWSETAGLLTKAKDVNLNILVKKWSPVPSQIKLLEQRGASIYFKQEIKIADKNSIVSRAIKKVPLKKRNYHELDAIGNNKRLDLVVISLGNHLDLKLLYYCDYLIKNDIAYALVIQLGTDLRSLSGHYVKSYRRAYRGAKKVYFVSERNKREMQVTLASDLSNSEIINNPFNYNQELVPIKSEIKIYQLACVASLNVLHKGQELLLKVLSAEKWKRRELKVNLYGKGDSQYHLEELIKYFDLENKVELKGHVKNKSEIWSENHACIMPSRMEGQSLAMLEALSCGRMVISTKVGGAEDLIKEGKTGFLIQAANIELIDQSLEKAWQARENWLSMGEVARQSLFERIDVDPVYAFKNKISNLLSQ